MIILKLLLRLNDCRHQEKDGRKSMTWFSRCEVVIDLQCKFPTNESLIGYLLEMLEKPH